MTPDEAETIALKAVAFLVADERALDIFVGLTGITADHLRAHLGDRAVLAGVLEHLLGNERQLLEFCEANDVAPEAPAAAYRALAGAQPEW